MTYSMPYSSRIIRLAIALMIALAAVLMPVRPAGAIIHEIIGALCSGDEIVPPGQLQDGQSFAQALRATGFVASIDFSVPGEVTVNFDPDVPSSKFISAGFDLTIPDGFGPGVDLILSPLVVPDPAFPAHERCPLFP